jgi:NAD(P)-dependent dehydrogenase (short-subunit alcohol dehydrogenase family)
MDLSNRVALVTGGKRIGAVVAIEMAKCGADIGLCYNRSRDEAEKTAASIKALGRRVFVRKADVTKAIDCEGFVNEGTAALGRLDILVNMASIYVPKPFSELTVAEYDENVAVDMRSAFICSRAAWPHMRKAGGGNIINFSDWLSRSGRPRYTGYLPYYVAKTGVIGITEALALELAPDKIRVNAICPVISATGMLETFMGKPDTPENRAAFVATVPLGRMSTPEDIANAALYLASDEAEFLTGVCLPVDGGRTA